MADLLLADTSIWVITSRRRAASSLQRRVQLLEAQNLLATCDVVMLEILRGSPDDDGFVRMSSRFHGLHHLPTGAEQWRESVRLGYDLKRHGANVGAIDILIAAVAITHDAIVLHADSDYERIAQHSALRTEPVFDLLTA